MTGRELRADYLATHYRCGYCEVVPRAEYRHCDHTRLCVEHVWQRAGKRVDHTDNYIPTCDAAHRWKHKFTTLGRIAATWWKISRGEFDRDAIRNLIGRDVIGWVSNQREDGLPAWADELARDILERF